MHGDLHSLPFRGYIFCLFMPSLAFILFFSTYYSPQGILLIQILIEYSRHEFENLLRGSSIHVISEDDAAISTEA